MVELERLGLYYARHGRLVTFDLDDLVVDGGWELLADYVLTRFAPQNKSTSDFNVER